MSIAQDPPADKQSYADGVAAYHSGKPHTANPHTYFGDGSDGQQYEPRDSWREGWFHAWALEA